MRQERTVQATIFEVFAGHQIGCELKAISGWLDGQRALVSLEGNRSGLGRLPKKVYLTFDDGPNPIYTPQVLNILKRKHVRATFFILGSRAEKYPDLVRRTFREGNEKCENSYAEI